MINVFHFLIYIVTSDILNAWSIIITYDITLTNYKFEIILFHFCESVISFIHDHFTQTQHDWSMRFKFVI